MRALICGILFMLACDSGWHEDSPVDRAVTRWQPIVGSDGHLVFALEPRLEHRIEHGVFVEGWQTTLAGPTLAVDAAGNTLATLPTGVMTTVDLPSAVWVLQQEDRLWTDPLPNEPPPRSPFAVATVVDRAQLAFAPTVTLTPPIVQPIALGDDLLDVPFTGESDAARDLAIRLRSPDGNATVLHAGRGFAAATCARGGALALAYQLETPATDVHVVVVRDRAIDSAVPSGVLRAAAKPRLAIDEWTLPAVRLDPRGLACDAMTAHVAIAAVAADASRHVLVIDTATHAVLADTPDVVAPLALRSDGGAVAAVRASDAAIVMIEGTDAPVDTGIVAEPAVTTPALVVGDVAVFETTMARRVLDLATGEPGPLLDEGMVGELVTITAWPDGGGFVDMREQLEFGADPNRLESVRVVTAADGIELPLPAILGDPLLTRVYGDAVYVSTHAGDDYHVFGYDLASATLRSDDALPRCDGTCQTPNQDGPGVAGTFRYTTGDGAAVDGALERMAIVHMTAAAAFSITGAFDDALGEHRTFEIDAGNFVPGMGPIDTAGLVQLCMVRATGDEPVCSDFAGTIDVRQLAADCYNHESGVGACAETIDFTLTASSAWEDTAFQIDATELTIGQWLSVACED